MESSIKTTMKITCGMGEVADYEILAQAGVDEVFCGFVPFSWNEKYQNLMPINRREVLFYHVQISCYEDMKILAKKIKKYGVPVAITFNSLYYLPKQLEEIAGIINMLSELGFTDYIIADINLIRYLSENKIKCSVHVSGELGEINEQLVQLLLELQTETTIIKRIIFHRKASFVEMEACRKFGLELEAFAMNENCHFTGGFCNSLHCDELPHMCQINYELRPEPKNYQEIVTDGCGLCSLYELRDHGIGYLKVVGRGQDASKVAKDVIKLRTALEILDIAKDIDEYKLAVKKQIFNYSCNLDCYYG